MSLLKDLAELVLENPNDFFTSGLQQAQENYRETKRLFTMLSFIIGVVCLGALFVRAIIF